MTESQIRQLVVDTARKCIGCKESDGSHKKIIDIYNSHKPLAVGYWLKYTDAWCSGFVSAVSIECKLTDIFPTECGCQRHIALFKKIGAWQEKDDYVPKPADVLFYDWQDSGKGDNTGTADHVGIVEKVVGNTITIIEGNYSNSVKRRTLEVNGKYIRGYGVPDYASKATKEEVPAEPKQGLQLPALKKGSTGESVKAVQILLMGWGYSAGKWDAAGEFGTATENAVECFQEDNELTVTGEVDEKTWAKMLGL